MSFTPMESEEQERKLFVGGLNKIQTDEESLRSFFIKYGGIIDCTIMRDADKQSRGFGFVLFDSASSVDEIISLRKEGKNFTLDDHHIEVKRALPKVPGGTAGSSRTGGLNRKIFVGGLPNKATDDDLKGYFSKYGKVTETELLRDRDTNRLRGFAFVTFEDEDSADKCIQRRTHEICKKICEVKRAQTRSNIKHDEEEYRGGSRYGGSRDHRDDRHGGGSQGPQSLGINEVNNLIQQAFMMGQQSVMNSSCFGYGQNEEASNSAAFQANGVPLGSNNFDNDAPREMYEEKKHSSKWDDREYSRKSNSRYSWRRSSRRHENKDKYNESKQISKTTQGVQPPTAASLLGQMNPAPFGQQGANANPLLQALMNQNSAPNPSMPQMNQAMPQTVAGGGNTNQLANQIAQLLQQQGRGGGLDANAINAMMKPDNSQQQKQTPQNGSYPTTYPASSSYDMYYNQNNPSSANYGPTKDDADSKRYRPY